jgi:hypothetical protein
MSTPCFIGKVDNKTDDVRFIYCHFDGYPEDVGYILDTYYKDHGKVEDLLNLGDISCLKEEVSASPSYTEKEIKDKVTVAYFRDKGGYWENVAPKHTQLANYEKGEYTIDYLYLYKDGIWYIDKENGLSLWTKVSDLLKDN